MSFKSAAFDLTVHGATPDIASSNRLLISSCNIPGAARLDAVFTVERPAQAANMG